MEQWNILRRRALTVQKCRQKFDACAELLLLLLLLLLLFVIKKSALSELEVLTEDTILHLPFVPSLLGYCRALRVLVRPRGSNPRPPTLKSKVFLAVSVVVTRDLKIRGRRRQRKRR